jgi:phage-related protein
VTIRNTDGRVLYASEKCPDKNPEIKDYAEKNSGYAYYGFFPGITPKVIGSDTQAIDTPSSANLYQKRQWEVVYACDFTSPSNVYQIPAGQTFTQLHENYRNLMMSTHNQKEGEVINPERDFPETLKWYENDRKREIENSPEFKAEVRRQQKEHYRGKKEHYKENYKEHYWDGDICKPIGNLFGTIANGILDVTYNPLVSGINQIGILRRSLGLTQTNVTVNWRCPIPGLGEMIAWISNAAQVVAQAFVDAYNFVCKVGEAVVGAVITTGKWLVNQLQNTFSLNNMKKFLRAFNNGMSCGFNSLGGAFMNSFDWVKDGVMGLVDCVTNFGSSVGAFFLNPSFDNFMGMITSFLALTANTFMFVLNLGLSILTFVADIVGAIIGFIADVGSWIMSSVIGPIADAIANAFTNFWNWLF